MTSVNELLMSHVVVRGVDTSVPPHKRVQAAWREWEALGDSYVARIARNGIQFDWIPGFDPLHPDVNYRPFSLSPYARDDLDDDEVLQREIDKLILAGHVSKIEPEDAKGVTSIFLVEKKPDPENPQGSSRPCTNLKPVNCFIHVTYFSLPTVREILPYSKKGYYACKLDFKSAFFHMPIAKRDAPWLAFRHRGRVFRWDCLPFSLTIHAMSNVAFCPIYWLSVYLVRTTSYEGPAVFVSLKPPRRPILASTINSLTTTFLRSMGLHEFTAHSTRGSAATALILLGVDPHVVCELGDWRSYDTFRRFYNRVRAMSNVAQSLAPEASADSEVLLLE